MLDALRTLTDMPPDDAVRHSREDLAEHRRREQLLEQARDRAQTLLQQAEDEADELCRAGFNEGYAQGVMHAATDLADMLVTAQTLTRQLHQNLASAARQLLTATLHRSELIEEIIATWLDEQQPQARGVLQVMLPERLRDEGEAFAMRLREQWSRVGCLPHQLRVDYHPQERYLMRLADQVLELDTESFQGQAMTVLSRRLAHMSEAERQLDDKAREALSHLLSAFIAPRSCSLSSISQPSTSESSISESSGPDA